jgi:phosphoribosylformylglycinamidine synthase subunit PurS
MYEAVVTITLRTSILDPEGKTVEHSLHQLGYENVQNVRIGKQIEFTVDAADEAEARSTIESVCSKLLANPVMEDYRYSLRESKEAAGR